jgi:hypothetical protein
VIVVSPIVVSARGLLLLPLIYHKPGQHAILNQLLHLKMKHHAILGLVTMILMEVAVLIHVALVYWCLHLPWT